MLIARPLRLSGLADPERAPPHLVSVHPEMLLLRSMRQLR
jgi:hypothetical protein